jgi:S1-C subfamily serine protease
VLVVAVSSGGPADAAGLRVGDVVLELDGAPTPTVDAIHKLLTGDRIDRRIALKLLRDGSLTGVALAVVERPRERRGA